jgi:signal transduction histidine kinase
VGRQTLEDLRRLLGVLRTDEVDAPEGGPDGGPQPPQPGLAQLDALVGHIRVAGPKVEVAVIGSPVDLPPALDLTAYRIVQEALTNTLKHGGATRVQVQLVYTGTALLIDVADDGAVGASDDGLGHGLVGISERVALFGGAVAAGPDPGGGWHLHAELPLPADVAHAPHASPLPAS